MSTWEAVLVGVLALLVLLWFGPGVKQAVRQSRRGTAQEWRDVLVPIALVVLFIVLLVVMVRHGGSG